jgi:outer membrane protein assembly factor BamB
MKLSGDSLAARVPRRLFGRRGASARSAIAVMTLLAMFTPAMAPAVAAQDGVDGNTYVSPQFGYELEWDEDVWDVDDEASDSRDVLVLLETDNSSLVYVEGYEAYDGNPDDCLEGSSDEILGADAVSDVEPLEDEDGDEIAGEDGGVVFAAYSYVYETSEGDEQDRVSYFTCQSLVEDEAVLAFSFIGLLDTFDDDQPAWDDLIAGLTLPDDAGAKDADEEETADDEDEQDSSNEDETGDRDRDKEDDDSAGAADVSSFAGGPALSGVQPGPAPADEPDELWVFETGDDFVGANAAAVSVEDGLVFTSSNMVYAFDIESGEEVWSYESDDRMGFVSPLALADGVLYAAGEDGSVYAFEAESGDIIWQSELTGGMPVNGGPMLADDVLYVTAWDQNAYALDIETGDVLWDTSFGGISYAQPAYADGYIILSAPTNGVIAIDTEEGEEAWSFETEGMVYGAKATGDGVVYAGSDDGTLYAIELESGDELWSVDTGGVLTTSLAVYDGIVYAANADAVLGAYDAESGDEIWTTDIDGAEPGGVTVTFTEDDDLLILVGDGDGVLHAYDEDGEEVYAVEVADAAIYWPATVIDGVIYVSARDGSVYALAA